MIEHEVRTVNESGSRRLVIRFCDAGEPVPNHITILPVPRARGVQADAARNICALEIDLGKEEDGDWWPVDAVIRGVRGWKLGLSAEDEAEIRRLFPHQWRRTGDSHVDYPIPDHVRCDNCGDHQGTGFWLGERAPDYHMPFAYKGIWCACCMTRAQLEWAEKEAARIAATIPELRAKLAAGCASQDGSDDTQDAPERA